MHAVRAAAIFILVAVQAGCGGGSLIPSPPPPQSPSNLVYSTNFAIYTKGVGITNNTPSNTGGAVHSYAVSPPLPAGLGLDGSTGVISGTPLEVAAPATYIVTATNSVGSASVELVIVVNDVAPSSLMYSANPAVYPKGVAVTDAPTNAGGTVVSYSVSPALPTGLSLDPSTGVISGTPTVITGLALFTVTATNSGGSTTVDLIIIVNDVAPSNLMYSANPAAYTKGVAITANTPTNAGGAVLSYSVSPALPPGLGFDATTGVISGTPTGIAPEAIYTVVAVNSGGATGASVVITVNDVAPSSLAYSANPAVFTKGIPVTPDAPTNAGGAVVSYSVSPALPSGVTLNTSTGVISGTPIAITATTMYTVTATNSAGSTTLGVTITVNDAAPRNLSYSRNPAVYANGLTIANNTPSSTGGTVVSYSVSPQLPPGLSLNSTSGVLSGNPTGVTAPATYTVTAANSGGFTSVGLVITVGEVNGPIVAGYDHTCAFVNGGVQCWGGNLNGDLGNNATRESNVPVQVQGLTYGVTAITASSGSIHTCVLVNGGAQCWGDNEYGQLGNSSIPVSPGPFDYSSVPIQVKGLMNGVTAIAAGWDHTCAVVDGSAQCWGDNVHGQLGNNSTTMSLVPVQVEGLSSGVQAIAAGAFFTCALVNGGVQCWGSNFGGSLGNNSTTDSPVPVPVQGLTSGVTAIAAGGAHACALVNGGLQCWGFNYYGQIGNNSTAYSFVPAQVLGLTSGVTAVAAGNDHTCALVNGGAWCWGYNAHGQIGNNSSTDSSVPVQVQGLTSGVQAIAAGYEHTCALVNGGAGCWGWNVYGQLGNNSTTNSSVPGQVGGWSL